jgi:hypothetical protein
VKLPAHQLIWLGNRYDLGDSRKRFKVAKVLANGPDHPEDGFLHPYDFLDQIVLGAQFLLQTFVLFLGDIFLQNDDHGVVSSWRCVYKTKNPQDVSSGFLRKNLTPGGSATHPGITAFSGNHLPGWIGPKKAKIKIALAEMDRSQGMSPRLKSIFSAPLPECPDKDDTDFSLQCQ